MAETKTGQLASIEFSYDGLQASSHRIDMRRFGYAIVGLDHIVTVGVIALVERRAARPRERLDFDVVVSEPRAGSVSILGGLMAAYQGAQGNLPFAVSLLLDQAPDFIWNWVSFVFKRLGGREKEAEKLLVAVMDQFDKMHERGMRDRVSEREFVLGLVDRLKPHASAMAIPLGTSADVARITDPNSSRAPTEIGIPEADAIRSKEPMEVGDPIVMRMRIDGLIKHTNRGTVELEDEPGRFVAAEIRDPLFEQTPNPYIAAMNSDELIEVTAVPSYKGGDLHRLYLMGLPGRKAA